MHKFDSELENKICNVSVKGLENGLAIGEIKEIKNSVALEISSI